MPKLFQKRNIKILKICAITILYIIIFPIFILNLIFIGKLIIMPNEIPSICGIKPFIVASGSMEPNIMVGDLILSKKIDSKMLKEQDIISFKDGNSVVTHRIVSINTEDGNISFATKGDNNNEKDSKIVLSTEVEGQYIKRIPKLGDCIMFMQSKIGMFVVVIVPLIIIFAYYIIASKISNNKKNEEILNLQKKLNEIDSDPKL